MLCKFTWGSSIHKLCNHRCLTRCSISRKLCPSSFVGSYHSFSRMMLPRCCHCFQLTSSSGKKGRGTTVVAPAMAVAVGVIVTELMSAGVKVAMLGSLVVWVGTVWEMVSGCLYYIGYCCCRG